MANISGVANKAVRQYFKEISARGIEGYAARFSNKVLKDGTTLKAMLIGDMLEINAVKRTCNNNYLVDMFSADLSKQKDGIHRVASWVTNEKGSVKAYIEKIKNLFGKRKWQVYLTDEHTTLAHGVLNSNGTKGEAVQAIGNCQYERSAKEFMQIIRDAFKC